MVLTVSPMVHRLHVFGVQVLGDCDFAIDLAPELLEPSIYDLDCKDANHVGEWVVI